MSFIKMVSCSEALNGSIYNEFGLIETRSYYVDDMLSWVEKNEYSQK